MVEREEEVEDDKVEEGGGEVVDGAGCIVEGEVGEGRREVVDFFCYFET